MQQVSFLHAADLHLDSPFKGFSNVPETLFQQMKDSTFVALDKLVQTAIQKQVDFVLLVGDLFDHETQSLKAQIRLRRAFERLRQHDIAVYLSYGNHDFLEGNLHPVSYPDNVFIFPSEEVTSFTYKKNGEALAKIYGFSYENRAVTEKMVHEYEREGDEIPFHIGMLHGSTQNNTEHDVYAPFQIGELVEKNMDYWALGHIHKREILKTDPPIVYPGNIQGRNRKEVGDKGCYHVALTELEAKLDFIPLQAMKIKNFTLDVSACKRPEEIENVILSEIELLHDASPQLLDVTLASDNLQLKQWENEHLLEDILEVINEATLARSEWRYVFRLSTKIKDQEKAGFYKDNRFMEELKKELNEASLQGYLTELYSHRQGRKYLSPLTKLEEEEIKKEAEEILLNGLWKG